MNLVRCNSQTGENTSANPLGAVLMGRPLTRSSVEGPSGTRVSMSDTKWKEAENISLL